MAASDTLSRRVDELYAQLTDQPPHTEQQEQLIKQILEFYYITFLARPRNHERSLQLMSKDFIHHDPVFGGDRHAVIKFADDFDREAMELGRKADTVPGIDFRFRRVLVDGDFVVLHIHVVRHAGDRGLNVMGYFRYRDGLLIEHWDCLSEVPEGRRAKDYGH